ncbi:polymer-forming cytoskeletal protein [Solidesulfovibrio sp.]|uniref:bactofilin family protein n=1 Tax=Solidesulfovibrio sp. TaxID=2910990 RepID=UPI002B1FE65C|nr:polymer-forming cytoskeletal protein [Solidesulfovibrio sp.]MEA4856539.1 polymer-forming cytoskeletal protein [Solidesulfovibrio sp.]
MFGRNARKKPRHDAITAFLGAGTQYPGQFHCQGVARIDGGVIGDIVSDGVLVLGEEGSVEGRIRVAELVASGRIVGDVEASRRVTFHARSNLRGNLLAPAMVIEDGAIINGLVRMGTPEETGRIAAQPPRALAEAAAEKPTEEDAI